MIVTRAFLSIDYKTAEILAMQARKDFLMLSFLLGKLSQNLFLTAVRFHLHPYNLSCLHEHRIYVSTGIKSRL